MSFLKRVPFFYIVFFFALGICSSYLDLYTYDLELYKTLFISTVLILVFLQTYSHKSIIPFIAGGVLFIFLGSAHFKALNNDLDGFPVTVVDTYDKVEVLGSVEKIVEYDTYRKATIKISRIESKDTIWNIKSINVLSFIKDSSFLCEGDKIESTGYFKSIKNKGEIDFVSIYHLQRIYFTFSFTKDICVSPQTNLKSISTYWKNKIQNTFQKYISDQSLLGIVNGMFLGDKTKMTRSELEVYKKVGVMHVFTVSGLHVGLVYILLMQLFSFFKMNSRFGSFIRWIITLLGIWLFVLLTGSQVSVVRAGIMLTFIATSVVLKRKASVYNSLCLSAFCLLVYDPLFLFQVGFQLSYAAVFGIFFLYKPIYNLWYFRFTFFDKVWQIICINISAWLFTLPFLLYYFHSFSTISILSGLLIIPLVSITMILVFVLLFIEAVVPSINSVVGYIITKVLYLIKLISTYIADFDFVYITDVNIDLVWVGLFFTTLILVGLFLQHKKSYLFYALASVTTLLVCYDLLLIIK